MNIGPYSFEEYIDKVKSFHGTVAPGMIAGGIMVDIAQKNLPEGELFDVISESGHCLPDAVQLLTPCTIGNGWLKIVDTSRYAMTFYNKYTGNGIRVYLDADKLSAWPEVRSWFLREKPKHEQSLDGIIREFKKAGPDLSETKLVQVKPEYVLNKKKTKPPIVICPSCHEAYSSDLGDICPACQGKSPYTVEE